jgi:hypothetical protein
MAILFTSMYYPPSMRRLFWLVFLLLIACPRHKAQAQSPILAELQRNYAMRYLNATLKSLIQTPASVEH